METQELRVNLNALNTNEEWPELENAIDILRISTEEEFKKIKKEKWYNRIWDMVTFSNKKEIRLADQITSLAQAQEIVLQILVRLSAADVEISKRLLETIKKLDALTDQTIRIRSLIRDLENVAVGINPRLDLNKLSEMERMVLNTSFYKLSEIAGQTTEAQQNYVNTVMEYLGAKDIQLIDVRKAMRKVDNNSRKIIYNCCLEYIFLNHICDEFRIDNKYNEFLNEFDVGNKTANLLKQQIVDLYKLRGEEGFFAKYQQGNFDTIEDNFYVDIDIIKTDKVIDSFVFIEPEKDEIIQEQNVFINSYIKCQGTLIFKNSKIYFGKSMSGIDVEVGGNIIFENCEIKYKYPLDKYFIECYGNSSLSLIGCLFCNCGRLVYGKAMKSLIMKGCTLENCSADFIKVDEADETNCAIFNNTFNLHSLEDWQIDNIKDLEYIAIVNIQNNNSQEYGGCLKVIGNSVLIDDEYKKCVASASGKQNVKISVLAGLCTKIYNCTFSGMTNFINTKIVESCRFENCTSVLNLLNNAEAKSCTFENCSYVFTVSNNADIVGCKFNKCFDNLIRATGNYGGIKVSYCQFNIMHNENYHSIELRVGDKSGTTQNEIKKCIFTSAGVTNLLVNPVRVEKCHDVKQINIEDTDFRNIPTHHTNGKVIETIVTYKRKMSWGKSRTKELRAVKINNCAGVDDSGRISPNFIIR